MSWQNPKLDWKTNPHNPIPDDFNRIEGNIDFLKTDIETKKGAIVGAVNTMGQTASLSDTHATLATKIKAISTDTTALSSDVRVGKTFYAGGVKRVGYAKDHGTLSLPIATYARSYTAGFIGGLTVAPLAMYPGDQVLWEDLAQIATLAASPGTGPTHYKKGQQMNYAGTIRVAFNLRTNQDGTGAYGRIYKNGVAFGTLRYTMSTSYVLFTEDLAVSVGDQIDLRIWRDTNQGQTAYNEIFRMSGQFKQFTSDY
jgi:hypothetical protein